jgi:hypothetical protein
VVRSSRKRRRCFGARTVQLDRTTQRKHQRGTDH